MSEAQRGCGAARAAVIVAVGLLGLGLAGSVRADWSDDFDAGFAQSWIFATIDDVGDPPATGVSAFEIVEAGGDDYLRISHTTTAFQDGGGGAADGFGFVNESFGNMAIVAEINSQPLDGQQSLLAVAGRGDAFSGSAYVAGVDFASSRFLIGRFDDTFGFIIPLTSDGSLLIDPNEPYRVQFFLLGTDLVARLIDASTGELLSTINTVDGVYVSGIGGVLVETAYTSGGAPVAPIIGTFDDVMAVPEPSFAALIGCGGGGLVLFGRVKRR